jgi:DNA-binding transcriptional ArsR family regulator
MSAQHVSALPAATGAAVSRLAGERDVIEAARRVHRALGDTNRLEVVRRLAAGPATVSELIEFTGLSHLRRLRAAGLVTTERSGRESICTLRTATIAEGHALMLSALGIADPAAWVAPTEALPHATPLVDAVRGEEA